MRVEELLKLSEYILKWGFCQIHGSFSGDTCFKRSQVRYITGAEHDALKEECARLRAALQSIATLRMDISPAGQLGMVIGMAEKALAGNGAIGAQRSTDNGNKGLTK